MILAILFIMILIIVNIRKQKESETSILFRIMANYLQLMTVTMSFNLKFPKILEDAFAPVERVGSSSGALISFDCFQTGSDLDIFTPSSAFFKSFLMAILPIVLLIFF